jgi:hypothetical protein
MRMFQMTGRDAPLEWTGLYFGFVDKFGGEGFRPRMIVDHQFRGTVPEDNGFHQAIEAVVHDPEVSGVSRYSGIMLESRTDLLDSHRRDRINKSDMRILRGEFTRQALAQRSYDAAPEDNEIEIFRVELFGRIIGVGRPLYLDTERAKRFHYSLVYLRRSPENKDALRRLCGMVCHTIRPCGEPSKNVTRSLHTAREGGDEGDMAKWKAKIQVGEIISDGDCSALLSARALPIRALRAFLEAAFRLL